MQNKILSLLSLASIYLISINAVTIVKQIDNTTEIVVIIKQDNIEKAINEVLNNYKNSSKLHLDLSESNWKTLSKEFSTLSKLNNLRHLNLSNNDLTKIPNKEITQLKNLATLNLSNNKIKQITANDWKALSYLKELNLSNNDINSISSKVRECQLLEKLDLSNNQIKEISGDIGYLNLLKVLDLRNNKITSFPKDLGPFNNTKIIYLEGNKLKPISEIVGKNRKLFELLLNLIKTKIYYKVLENLKVEFESPEELKDFENIKRLPKKDSMLLPLELVKKIHEYSGFGSLWNSENQ